MTGFFGEQRDLRSISEGDADDWRHALAEKYVDATLNKHIKRARQFCKSAVRKGLADKNPFADVKGGSEQNETRQQFIDLETTGKVLESCPDVEWQAIVALARFGGVRTPSESLGLRWVDVDWENDRFTVMSPKTKKQGKPFATGTKLQNASTAIVIFGPKKDSSPALVTSLIARTRMRWTWSSTRHLGKFSGTTRNDQKSSSSVPNNKAWRNRRISLISSRTTDMNHSPILAGRGRQVITTAPA